MVLMGLGALAQLGLALPTGLAFGYGYGYGVRAGYHGFKVPDKKRANLHLSPNPVQGAFGAGLHSAHEVTGGHTPLGQLSELPSAPVHQQLDTGTKTPAQKLKDGDLRRTKCGKLVDLTGVHDKHKKDQLIKNACRKPKYRGTRR